MVLVMCDCWLYPARGWYPVCYTVYKKFKIDQACLVKMAVLIGLVSFFVFRVFMDVLFHKHTNKDLQFTT